MHDTKTVVLTGRTDLSHTLLRTAQEYGRIDVLVNNAGEQHPVEDITRMEPATIQRTFRTNVSR